MSERIFTISAEREKKKKKWELTEVGGERDISVNVKRDEVR